jgi:FtsP/CotA-like multicopper oxidase with cupredoxin domain
MGGASAAALYMASRLRWMQRAYAQIAGGSLDPTMVPKYRMPLVKPPAMSGVFQKSKTKFNIALRQFTQPILPPSGPGWTYPGDTTVWSYGPFNDPRTVFEGGEYFYPAFTLENRYNVPTQIRWVNDLKDNRNNFLPHILPVDPALHWANPIGRRDTRPNPTDDPTYWDHRYIDQDGRYTGPVPMVVHVHGAHVVEQFDGYAEAWYLPNAKRLDGLHTKGTFFDYYKTKYGLDNWGAGKADFIYSNDQPATTLWYHDHTLGMTRLNVYAGPAGFWLVRGGPGDMVLDSRDDSTAILPGPAPGVGDDPFGDYYEIPIAIQDRSFNDDGSLFYPDHRAFFEGLAASDFAADFPFIFDGTGWGLGCDGEVSDVARTWQPEFFGNMMVVNGFTWPYLDTEKRRYRLRLLNGCNSRFLILEFDNPNVEVWQIGAEQGFLPAPVRLNNHPYPGSSGGGRATILMGPAERADVIVDFSNVPVGSTVKLLNLGPDEPFGGGDIGDAFAPADPATTGQVMEFRIIGAKSPDMTTPPQHLQLPAVAALSPTPTRDVSLNEEESHNVNALFNDDLEQWEVPVAQQCDNPDAAPFGPTEALLGTLEGGFGAPKMWAEKVTENPALNSTEEWTFYNLTADAHPMHVHLVKFQVVNRQALEVDDEGVALQPAQLVPGTIRPPEAWETGNKDTVISYPGEVTRIKMKFDLPGFYVWHCHIVEHEDNEMMRPFVVGPQDPDAPHPHT